MGRKRSDHLINPCSRTPAGHHHEELDPELLQSDVSLDGGLWINAFDSDEVRRFKLCQKTARNAEHIHRVAQKNLHEAAADIGLVPHIDDHTNHLMDLTSMIDNSVPAATSRCP